MDVSTGTSMMQDGIETYTFRIGIGGAATIAELTKRGTFAVNTFLAGLYMYINRPEPDDIISATLERGDTPEEFLVTVLIRRGHYTIASFCKAHWGHRVEVLPTGLFCYHCDASHNLDPDAFAKQSRRWLNRN